MKRGEKSPLFLRKEVEKVFENKEFLTVAEYAQMKGVRPYVIYNKMRKQMFELPHDCRLHLRNPYYKAEKPKAKKTKRKIQAGKEFLYVGHYIDTNGTYILKIGTTNNLERRRKEHTRNYHRTKMFTLPADQEFQYDWYLPLSKYNTLRFEDSNRKAWQDQGIGAFVRNDRFACPRKPDGVTVTIRKVYKIPL